MTVRVVHAFLSDLRTLCGLDFCCRRTTALRGGALRVKLWDPDGRGHFRGTGDHVDSPVASLPDLIGGRKVLPVAVEVLAGARKGPAGQVVNRMIGHRRGQRWSAALENL